MKQTKNGQKKNVIELEPEEWAWQQAAKYEDWLAADCPLNKHE